MSDSCAECGHRLVYHGDRAVTACDGGYGDLAIQRYGERRVCSCPGWQPA